MVLTYKDKKIKKYFEENKSQINEKDDQLFHSQMKEDKELIVSSNLFDLDYLEDLSKKTGVLNLVQKSNIVNPDEELNIDSVTTSYLKRIESKQNAILEILQCMPMPSVSQVKFNEITEEELDCFTLNLKLFCSKFVILSTDSGNKIITNILESLKEISECLISNSFYSFVKETSAVKKVIKDLDKFGISNSKVNKNVEKSLEILNNIDKASKLNVFEQSSFYATLLLEKGYTLNAITLINEASGIYIVDSVKKMSDKICKYTSLIGEKDPIKLNTQAKDFFINLFFDNNTDSKQITFFPHHKIVKELDTEITNKFLNLQRTWVNKGDDGLFKRYAYIITMVRKIRNKLAHVNMDIDFKSLESQIKTLNEDFQYLTMKKNILKNK